MLTTLASFGLLTMTHQSMADYYGISVVTLKKYKRFDGYFTSHQLQSFLRNNTHKNSKHLKKSSCKSSSKFFIYFFNFCTFEIANLVNVPGHYLRKYATCITTCPPGFGSHLRPCIKNFQQCK